VAAAVERAKQVTMTELNAIIGVRICLKMCCKIGLASCVGKVIYFIHRCKIMIL